MLVSRGPEPLSQGTDADGLYMMTIMPSRSVRLRSEQVRFERLGERIQEIFRTRNERLLLVRVEGQPEFRDVIEALDCASSRVRLHYALMTDQTEPTPGEPTLFLEGKAIYTQYFVKPVPLLMR
jgi:biopolymer transport protein ExbD